MHMWKCLHTAGRLDSHIWVDNWWALVSEGLTEEKLTLTTWTMVRSLLSPLQSVLLLKAACIWAVEFVWTLYGRRLIIVDGICCPIAVSWQNLYAFLPLECGLHYFIFGSLISANNKCSVFLKVWPTSCFFFFFKEYKQPCILWMQGKQYTMFKYMLFTTIADDTFFSRI